MSDIVKSLISELEAKGWSSNKTDGKLIFSRDEVIITGYQEYVSVQLGDFSTSKIASKYLETMKRLEFLLQQIRLFAEMADNGTLVEMARWDSALKTIHKSSWEQALKCPKALQLIEQAIDILQSTSV